MTIKRRKVGAWDLMQELQRDPEWVERDRKRQEKHQASVDALQAEMTPEEQLFERDLAAVGSHLTSVFEMVNTSDSYPEAIPILLKHLPVTSHPVLRQAIGRALAVAEAEGLAGPKLLTELRREHDAETRWVFANTLTIVADRKDTEQLREMVDDPSYEDVRERLHQALKNVL
ncbi:HEAT repeat domain-containing protein [Sphingomonas sp. 1P06PA]|uniref:HEAT repeat domain-containing protein n=1 Tax=Sphingomonas sp. 1P06PA TaxID=554121 RepID=UPI0039A57FCD